MSIIQKWNQLFFTPMYSVFEILCFIIIGNLASQFGWVWFLAIIPVIFISNHMNYLFKKEQDDRTKMAGE